MKLIAHRHETPLYQESSLENLLDGAKAGMDAVECDLRRTGDHQYVIFHDPSIRRLSGEELLIAENSLDALNAAMAKAGRHIMTLEELKAGYHEKTPILLHVKLHETGDELMELLRTLPFPCILGLEMPEMVKLARQFKPREEILSFMPKMEMYPEFIAAGSGIIRLWEQWVRADEDLIGKVKNAGAPKVWIMSWNGHEMSGSEESLDTMHRLGADGVLLNDIPLALAWREKNQ